MLQSIIANKFVLFRKLQPNRLMKVKDLKKVLTQYGAMPMTDEEVMITLIYKLMIVIFALTLYLS